MDLCFSNYANIRLRGEDIKKILKEGEPDYYMRQGSNVFLFEFKDSTLNAKIKHSGEFKKIKKSVLEKFEETSDSQRKGIKQIINSIIHIYNSLFNRPELDLYDSENITIYPIIVHTDCSFEVEGINYILKERFKELLIEKNINNRHLIKDVVIINLDTLIALQDLFKCNKLELSTSINDYLNYSSNESKILNRLYPFDKFLFQQAHKVGYRYLAPTEFKELIKEQIEKDK